ncbi:Holliday junction branch migration protein RuvA [Pseudoclavibacter chungangensis]|uniref:Holliday junction branch migration complex subunit RuvA n=1 Tax=Pseudoclavibacter chungangensis TaxID=587635 RepID=A0A7J5BU53_9MICO|nr:Holliday junction branch migration protein RuvA [Pseudoclavibacter chungangensis]KAB1657875.1 Holliday junction branch migration protein RuvA [Pseudoclavibacter chungangensis]NYJ66522.1 Holliday junction DNA helicase RuvA [Pseudoclavibacter chungangensis]
MIASLRGTVVSTTASSVLLDVSGVGYRVLLTPNHVLELRRGAEVTLLTHLVVREDQWTLYGFRTDDELEVFERLISVSGVGPKSALGVLSQLTPDAVARAVVDEDVAAFKRVSGIGPKSAGLIVVSLAGKLRPPAHAATDGDSSTSGVPPAVRTDVVEALVGLGYAERVAAPVVEDAIAALDDDGADVAAVLRASLRLLGPAKGAR